MSNSNPSNNFNSGFEFGLDSRTEGVTDEKANGAPGSLNCSSAQTNYVTLPTTLLAPSGALIAIPTYY